MFIWERFLASQMAPAILEQTTVSIMVEDYEFVANGSVTVFKGFMEVYVEGKDEEDKRRKYLPKFRWARLKTKET